MAPGCSARQGCRWMADLFHCNRANKRRKNVWPARCREQTNKGERMGSRPTEVNVNDAYKAASRLLPLRLKRRQKTFGYARAERVTPIRLNMCRAITIRGCKARCTALHTTHRQSYKKRPAKRTNANAPQWDELCAELCARRPAKNMALFRALAFAFRD